MKRCHNPQAGEEAREVKYCIQGDGLAMADEKTQRGGYPLQHTTQRGLNNVFITGQTIITAAAVVAAVIALLGYLLKGHKWYLKQEEHDKEITELRQQHKEDVDRIKKENCLICYALSACLDGLEQLGANHTVPIAKEKLDKYLNQQAHE